MQHVQKIKPCFLLLTKKFYLTQKLFSIFNIAPSPITGVIGPETLSCKYESFGTIFQILGFLIPIFQVGFFPSRIFPESDFSRVGFFPSRIRGAIGPEMVVLMGGFPESDFSRVGSGARFVLGV